VEGVKTFYFDEPAARQIPYKSGQFLTFVDDETGIEIRRSYSVASSPILHEPLAVGVKRISNGYFSRKLIDTAKVGDQLTTIGAGGFFILPENIEQYQQLFFFAAGSGITPIYSLIKTVLYVHPHISVVLIYSNPSKEKTIFYKELNQLQKQFAGRFHIEFLFSNSPHLVKAHLHADLIRKFINHYAITDYNGMLFYICGPLNYMRLCTFTLQLDGVLPGHIKKESFNADKAIRKAQPPDKEAHVVRLLYQQNKYDLNVQYPTTILQAAKKQRINLPYSCEVGRCGNCAAKCIKGKVWHSNNEVLTDADLAAGLVLTCVGYPVGGDVVIDIE